jgi:hypothetical protein
MWYVNLRRGVDPVGKVRLVAFIGMVMGEDGSTLLTLLNKPLSLIVQQFNHLDMECQLISKSLHSDRALYQDGFSKVQRDLHLHLLKGMRGKGLDSCDKNLHIW